MLISELIQELETVKSKLGDVGVYVFRGKTLSIKVDVLEEADMVVIRNKTVDEMKKEQRVQAGVDLSHKAFMDWLHDKEINNKESMSIE